MNYINRKEKVQTAFFLNVEAAVVEHFSVKVAQNHCCYFGNIVVVDKRFDNTYCCIDSIDSTAVVEDWTTMMTSLCYYSLPHSPSMLEYVAHDTNRLRCTKNSYCYDYFVEGDNDRRRRHCYYIEDPYYSSNLMLMLTTTMQMARMMMKVVVEAVKNSMNSKWD